MLQSSPNLPANVIVSQLYVSSVALSVERKWGSTHAVTKSTGKVVQESVVGVVAAPLNSWTVDAAASGEHSTITIEL